MGKKDNGIELQKIKVKLPGGGTGVIVVPVDKKK